MCKKGISVLVKEFGRVEEKGRAFEIRVSKETGKIVCDFKGDDQKECRLVDINHVNGFNKKSTKLLIREIKALHPTKKLFTPKFNPTVVG